MRAFYFLPQNIHVNHPSIFDKLFYFLTNITCQKEKEVLQCFLVERRRGFLMGAVWIIFIPFIVIFYASIRKEDKRIEQTYQND